MTVLITGGAGYIGSHMVRCLLDAGETPLVVDNLVTGFDWLIPETVPFLQADVGDIARMETILREHAVEAVIHFAGSVVLPESVSNPLKYYRNNTAVSRNLIEACVTAGVDKFIFSSTAAVYGDPDEVPVREDAPLRPQSPYGLSKLMTELMLKDVAAAHPFRYTALRYFNVAGADPKGRTGQATLNATNLIKIACETALGKRDHMTIFGTDYPTVDGTGVRDYIHVWDLVEAHRLALLRLRAGGDSVVMNCGYGRGSSVRQVIDAVQAASGARFDVRLGDRRPGDMPEVIAANDLITRELNWKPQLDDLSAIIRHALDWEAALSRRNRI
ncbi:UDP-glucose 4-epimerase GalE [Microvirga tunisiensis]|uniref:UDP-glucose 4-epimerase GalE n=2 Tax=Pannonibacter tanglangensis TaxID=2750084 RepID=A0ABW9ZDT3_9HYPH|nr:MULTISPECIES: UDP-glucose 4-epimerase GalE [unclassified Pannonibacter]NBN63010.1 UDP-glucose 4-epimerase GalE [Pannonibacter sp. XCT-34]NBN78582.1 UDP-glucose 4-epimerase GalE [Pannonibacter sp. XCT-53]